VCGDTSVARNSCREAASRPPERDEPLRRPESRGGEKKAQREREQREAVDADPTKDPLKAKARREALEKKAKIGDVYANRELRENEDSYYGGICADVWELLTKEQRAIMGRC
jgi:hypothetical protein